LLNTKRGKVDDSCKFGTVRRRAMIAQTPFGFVG